MQQHTVNDSLNKEDRKCGMRLNPLIGVAGACAVICFSGVNLPIGWMMLRAIFGIALCAAVLSASSYFYSQDPAYLSLYPLTLRRKTHYDPFKKRSTKK